MVRKPDRENLDMSAYALHDFIEDLHHNVRFYLHSQKEHGLSYLWCHVDGTQAEWYDKMCSGALQRSTDMKSCGATE